ncbi:WhiB family transcriptional regulator [Micrococcales bacterium 31B]|nr:WhiB family transcriptional regulator [Micrococcales bacterium 31B]
MTEISNFPTANLASWEWQYQGACRQAEATLFFHPDGERGPSRRKRDAAAKAVCAQCPVIEICRKQALAMREPYGVWGGLTEDERMQILSSQSRNRNRFAAS